jgi:hypothetical protein
MSAPPLTTDETLAMIERMAELADATAQDEPWDEKYWDGWAEGLRTLAQHIRTGVKVTCFPVGSCQCHPWTLPGKPRPRRKLITGKHPRQDGATYPLHD